LAPPSVGRSRSLFNRSEKLAHGVSYPPTASLDRRYRPLV
jgi:hypothetical protein